MRFLLGFVLAFLSVPSAHSAGEGPKIRASLEGGLPPENLVSNPGFESKVASHSGVWNWIAYSNRKVLAWLPKKGEIEVESVTARAEKRWETVVPDLRAAAATGILDTDPLEEHKAGPDAEAGAPWEIVLPDAPIVAVTEILNMDTLEEHQASRIKRGGRIVLRKDAKALSEDHEIECQYTYLSKARTGHGSIRISSAKKESGIWRQDIPPSAIPKGTRKVYGEIHVCGAQTTGVVQLMCRVKCKDGSSYQTPAETLVVNGDFGWRPLRIRFGDTREIESFGIYVSGTLAGTVWFDDALFVPGATKMGFSSDSEGVRRLRIVEQFAGDGVSTEFPFSTGEQPMGVSAGDREVPVWKGGFNYVVDFQKSRIRFRKPVDKGKAISLLLYQLTNPGKRFTHSVDEALTVHTYALEAEAEDGGVERYQYPKH